MKSKIEPTGSSPGSDKVTKSIWDEWQQVKAEIKQCKERLGELQTRETELARGLSNELNERTGNRQLTARQLTVLEMLKGVPQPTNKEIAAKLNISERTVKFHISDLLRIFGVQSRKELFVLFVRPPERNTYT